MSTESLFVFYVVLILLAITPLVVLRILSERQKIVDEKMYRIISFICWAVIIGGIIGIVFTTTLEFISFTAFIAAIIAVILLVASIIASATLRPRQRSQQYALLWSMTIAVEKNIPLVPTIEAFAQGRGGAINIKARRLAQLLKSGVPLPEALDLVPGILPQNALLAIRVGYESGALAGALRQAVLSRDSLNIIRNSLFTKALYIFLVLSFGLSILFFMMMKIVPSYEKIFKDFGTDLPGVTRTLIAISHFIVNFWYIFLPFYLFIMGVLIYFLTCYLRSMPFNFPGISRLMRRRHAAVILDSLALAAQCNQPLGRSVAVLAEKYPEPSIRQKLYCVEHDINQGADWCESLRLSGLIKQADQAVLQAAQRVGNLPWALGEMADSNRRRLAYRLHALVQLAYPPVILCLGGAVMFVVVALFCPLITLVTKLVGQ